jgi:hypothetical protein
VLYDPKHQHAKWDLTDPWLVDAAADRRATRDALAAGTLPGAFWPSTRSEPGDSALAGGPEACQLDQLRSST